MYITFLCTSVSWNEREEGDCENGGMMQEQVDTNTFLTWLATEETTKFIELILSKVEQSDSLIWQEQHVYRCGREYTSGKRDHQRITQWEKMIPLKKMGCQCHLTIKLYLHINKILRKYDKEHNHAIGNENLWFTGLLDTTKELIMELAHAGVNTKAIVCDDYLAYFSADGYLSSTNTYRNLAHAITVTDAPFSRLFEVIIIRYDKSSTWSWDSSHDHHTCKNITWSHVTLGK